MLKLGQLTTKRKNMYKISAFAENHPYLAMALFLVAYVISSNAEYWSLAQ